MPKLNTYNDEKHEYSVDMMIAYVNVMKLKPESVNIEENMWQIDQNVWGDYSPSDVLANPERKKFAKNVERIREADLKYPILMTSRYQIIDGYHRFLKAVKQGKKEIKAYILEPHILRKFVIPKEGEIQIHDLIELFHKRFD